MNADPKRIVERGYDAIADTFEDWAGRIEGSERDRRIADLLGRLPQGPDVLELGCGAGVSSTRLLAKRGRLIGVDISAEQIRRARERIPEAEFICADLGAVEFDDASFDAVVSLYVFNHLPREELPPLLTRIVRWLRPGGYLLATFSAREDDDAEESARGADSANGICTASRDPRTRSVWVGEWLGVEMFFDGEPMDAVLEHIRVAGLDVEDADVETFLEPEPDAGEARFLWVRARKP